MPGRSQFRWLLPLLLVVFLLPPDVSGWFLDGGLEDQVAVMQAAFRRRDLTGLYRDYVDGKLKTEIAKLVDKMKKDRGNGPRISRRLKFRSYKEYSAAGHDEVISHFFDVMLRPPEKKQTPINNSSYLRLALVLSLLFAHYDRGMGIVRRDVSSSRARIYYKGNGFNMIAYFVKRSGRWHITNEAIYKQAGK